MTVSLSAPRVSEIDHPVYDCVYLALAAARAAPLATADDRLQRGAKRVGVRVWSVTGPA